jgi:long-chain acyl-CoA synthetase
LILAGGDDIASARAAGGAGDVPVLEVEPSSLWRPNPDTGSNWSSPTGPDLAELSYLRPDAPGSGAVAISLTHTGLATAASTMATHVLRLAEDDIVLSCIPLLSVLGQTCSINATITAGARLVIPGGFGLADILRTIPEERVSVLTSVPLLLPALVREARRRSVEVSSLRAILVSGGSPVSERVRAGVVSTFGCELLESYGPTEFSSLTCATPSGNTCPTGSVGTPVPGVDVRIDGALTAGDTGELTLRGPQLMQDYWNAPESTSRSLRDGCLHTGTGARMDADGNVYLADGGWIDQLARPTGRFSGLLRQLGER